MQSKWIEITDEPATLPPMGQTVIVRKAGGTGFERFGWRVGQPSDGWRWYQSRLAYWRSSTQSIEPDSREDARSPTHWRPIA